VFAKDGDDVAGEGVAGGVVVFGEDVWLRRMKDGGLSLEGQDFDGAIGEFFGSSFFEYEWG
jgi:hypothetical protein